MTRAHHLVAALAVGLWLTVPALTSPVRADAPTGTFSIVARDPATGQLGVAVQSHWFSVGAIVPWAEAGVGAVATQSFIDVRYGVRGLQLMEQGKPAGEALKQLLAADSNPAVRQVGMIDADGNIAQHTGENCIQHAGHLAGGNFAVQANLMAVEGVPQAMARRAVPVSVVSYRRVAERGLRRDVLYCYDLELPEDFEPRNTDGEVESFMCLPVEDVAQIVRDTDEFKLNCNLVIIDFLVRHGVIDPGMPGYLDLVLGLRQPLNSVECALAGGS